MRTRLPNSSILASALYHSTKLIEVRNSQARTRLDRRSDAPDCFNATTKRPRLAGVRCLESRPDDRLIESHFDSAVRSFKNLAAVYLFSHDEREPAATAQLFTTSRAFWPRKTPQ
jgi:hypothetical protein